MSFKTPLLLIVFNRPDKTNNLLKILPGHTNRYSNIQFSPDGLILASGSINNIKITPDKSPKNNANTKISFVLGEDF